MFQKRGRHSYKQITVIKIKGTKGVAFDKRTHTQSLFRKSLSLPSGPIPSEFQKNNFFLKHIQYSRPATAFTRGVGREVSCLTTALELFCQSKRNATYQDPPLFTMVNSTLWRCEENMHLDNEVFSVFFLAFSSKISCSYLS
jgi:hypothetical protein